MSSLHQHTPSLTAFDPRGLTLRTVAYYRAQAQDEPQARVHRQTFSAGGQLQQQWDARLHRLHKTDPAVQANQRLRHSLSGRILRSHSIDAGWRIALSGIAGQLLSVWDARGSLQRYEFDAVLRPVAVYEQADDDTRERCTERLEYGAMNIRHAARNQCGRLIRHDDPAGSVLYEQYALSGAIAQQGRLFLRAEEALDWSAQLDVRKAQLETECHTSAWRYDALGGLVEQTDAKGNRQQSLYGPEGELTGASLVFSSGTRKRLFDLRTYNAQGQVESERAGNNVQTLATYRPHDGRLLRLTARKTGNTQAIVQDLTYTYDRVGNVLSIRDAAQPTTWASNTKIEATASFEYDTLYQLIKATGRENAHHAIGPALPALAQFGSTDSSLMRNYTRHYQYNEGGNLVQMQHVPSSGQGYTQRINTAAHSNHGVLNDFDSDADPLKGFDKNGNQQLLMRGQAMSWNARNQLQRVTQVVREQGSSDDETYGYDGAGLRVFKRRSSLAKNRQHVEQVRYLPGLELHSNDATGESFNVLSIEAGFTRVRALVWEHHRPAEVADEQLRFSLVDATASSTLELDEQAALLSQEGYYPFGGTAWWAAKSQVEARFKTVRYSGKERDATGLYYYGYRYYAPWLMRWISPDPAGDVDSLNLYAMVGNNPVTLTDAMGLLSSQAIGRIIITGVLTLAGYALGWASGYPREGAMVGAAAGFALGLMSWRAGVTAEQPQSTDTREQIYAQLVADALLESAQHRGLSREETNRLVNFIYTHRVGYQGEGLAVVYSPADNEGIYAYIGSALARQNLQARDRTRDPVPSELRRMGFRTIQLRDSGRASTSETPASRPSHAQGSVSQFESQAATQLARKRVGKKQRSEPSGESTSQAAAASEPRLIIDESQITHLMGGAAGRSIGIALGHLQEGRFPAVNWHRHNDGLWSVDLHGHPGSTRRGALRLMFEHTGGRNYRAVGVRDPHRR
ncbi:RHS repeat protein [Pseudomonas helleri]|uniref:RHS repeat protein n=2 Tax=Pseudomonas TaxID=286 RepID=A0A7X1WCD0_9PSED|nr:RHS repeat protein [Pseudomonas helleri]